jgi:hypothetical protein
MRNSIVFLSVILLTSACIGIKPANSSKANRYFETFYVGDEGIQYFIKPIVFSGTEKSALKGDFNFRTKGSSTSEVIFNFSILGNSFYKSVDSIVLKNPYFKTSAYDIALTYNESGKQYISRFTSKIAGGNEIVRLFDSPEWEIHVYKDNVKTTFDSSRRKTKNKILSLQKHLFVFLQ